MVYLARLRQHHQVLRPRRLTWTGEKKHTGDSKTDEPVLQHQYPNYPPVGIAKACEQDHVGSRQGYINMLLPRVDENSEACIAVQTNSLNAEGPMGEGLG